MMKSTRKMKRKRKKVKMTVDECEFNEGCVREEHRNKVLKKKNEKRN